MADPYTFTFDVEALLSGQDVVEEEAPKEGVMKRPVKEAEAKTETPTESIKTRLANALKTAFPNSSALGTAPQGDTSVGRNKALSDWTASTEFTPKYRGDVPSGIMLDTPPPVTTTDLGPDMDTLSMQDAQEQAAIRSVSGITESLGRPSGTATTEVDGLMSAPDVESESGVSVGGADAATDMYPTQGLMSPPVQDTVSEVDTDTAEPVVEEEETATTTPTRDELIDSVFDAEGGYSTDVNDTGNYYRGQFVGTNHGISAPVLAEHLGRTPTVEDMRGLSQATAREIAATQYYDTYNISDLPDDTQEIVFHAVYMGGSRGVRAVQNLTGATPDGVMGPNTRTAMQESTFTPQEYRDEYLRELEFGTTGYSNPANTWDTHGRGWTNRYNTLAGE